MKRLTIIIAISFIFQTVWAQHEINIPIQSGECWYGIATGLGPQLPLQGNTRVFNLQTNGYSCQGGQFLVSSQGRYLWCDKAYTVQRKDDVLFLSSPRADIELGEGGTTLRDAYMAVSKHFPPSGKTPPEEFFLYPTYNTWIELGYQQNQKGVMEYAHNIVKNGMHPGVLMIDGTWQFDHGEWAFRADRFPNPKEMVDSLHAMGFKVMLWVSPFISPDCMMYRTHKGLYYRAKGKKEDAILKWWVGFSAGYDLSNPEAFTFLTNQFRELQDCYGIDGFKFDAGDCQCYQEKDIDVFDGQSYDVEQTRLWAQLAKQFPYNELRACWGEQSQPIIQRLGDRDYSWEAVTTLIPSLINAGLLGYQFTCPDMIGGGMISTFEDIKEEDFDPALIIRSCQIHSMMPMMQFSVAPWRILKPEHMDIIRHYADLHVKMGPYIMEQARKAAETGEPIVRHMDYSFPGEGFEAVTDQYMLGDRYLVAPICTPEEQRTVRLPRGRWRDEQGKKYKGGRSYVISVPLERLPYFEKL